MEDNNVTTICDTAPLHYDPEEWTDEEWNEWNTQWTDEEWDAWYRTEGWGRWTEEEWLDWKNGGWAVFERWGYT